MSLPAIISKKRFYWIAAALYATAIFGFSSLSAIPDIPFINVPGGDKVFHAAEYAGLSFLFYRALRETYARVPVMRLLVIAFFAAGLYAVGDEFHQSFVDGRTASMSDALADHVGILIGMGISLL